MEMARGPWVTPVLLPGSGGCGRPGPFPPLSYRLSASLNSLPCDNNRHQAVANSTALSKPEGMPPQPTIAPRSNGRDAIMLSPSVPIVYTRWHNHVKGFPTRNPNYWDIYGSGRVLAIAFILTTSFKNRFRPPPDGHEENNGASHGMLRFAQHDGG
jgi:hypothetical protein